MILTARRLIARFLMAAARKTWAFASAINPDPSPAPWFYETGYDRYKRW